VPMALTSTPSASKRYVGVCYGCQNLITSEMNCSYDVVYRLEYVYLSNSATNSEDNVCFKCYSDPGRYVVFETEKVPELLSVKNEHKTDLDFLENYMKRCKVTELCTCGKHKVDPRSAADDDFDDDYDVCAR